MRLLEWLRPPRHVLTSFLAIMLVLAAALSWLGWRLLQQDRSLAGQRTRERLEHAADRIVVALEHSLSELDGLISTASPSAKALPEDLLLLRAGPRVLETYPADRLLYYPELPVPPEPGAGLFQQGELFEYRQNDPAKAITEFRRLVASRDPSVRAGGLLRLGRSLRKARRFAEALEVYAQLEKLGSTFVAGLPAELVAREARCSVLEETGPRAELERQAGALYADLQRGRWRLPRSAYQFHTEEAQGWMASGSGSSPPQPTLALAAGVEALWNQWRESPSKGRHFLKIHDQFVLLVWAATPDRLTAVVAGPRYLEALLQDAARTHSARIALADAEGRLLLGQLNGSDKPQALRTAAATKMPWTVHVASANPDAELSALAGRRRLLLAGCAIMALLLLSGAYFISRAMTRELAVLRLQSDFVAAVSHEFRTPLTAMRQLSELLAKGRVPAEQQRQRSYEILAKAS